MSESDPPEDRSDVAELEGMIMEASSALREEDLRAEAIRQNRYRVARRIIAVVMISLTCWGLRLFWTHPLIQSAPLPEGVEKGKQIDLDDSTGPPTTEAGRLTSGPPYSRNYRWVGTLYWTHKDGSRDTIAIHLGESVHIDGLGTITLTDVNPDPIIPEPRYGGWTCLFNLTLDPDVTLQY